MYKTQYKSFLETNNLTADDLYKKDKALLDDVISLENEITSLSTSIADADKEDVPGINESIANKSAVLAQQDKFLCERIAKTPAEKEANKAKMAKAAGGRKHNQPGYVKPGTQAPPANNGNTQQPGTHDNDNGDQPHNNTDGNNASSQPGNTNTTQPAQTNQAASQQPNTATPATESKKEEKQKPVKKGKINVGALIFAAVLTLGGFGYGMHAFKTGKFPFNKK